MQANQKYKKKIIAFYLPQFHTIPENDKWWGKGFTEWTNAKKAVPLYEGHYQPHVPLNEDYYDLSNVTVMERQAKLAQEYGVYGFCYYHYWFKDGKKLLEKPLENMLSDMAVDIPFCLCWANENWCRTWTGDDRDILMEQDYGSEKDWQKHYDYLKAFWDDERYIKIDERPIFVIYKPGQIPGLKDMIAYWNANRKSEGKADLLIMKQYPEVPVYDSSLEPYVEYVIKFQPINTLIWKEEKEETNPVKRFLKNTVFYECYRKLRRRKPVQPKLLVCDYDEAWNNILNVQPFGKKYINGAFVSWDNTARNVNGTVFHGADPEKFEYYMGELLKKDSPLDLIFLNAWNEWGEGAHIEPDERYGYGFLEALKRVQEESQTVDSCR